MKNNAPPPVRKEKSCEPTPFSTLPTREKKSPTSANTYEEVSTIKYQNWLSKDQIRLESYQDIDEITNKILTNTGWLSTKYCPTRFITSSNTDQMLIKYWSNTGRLGAERPRILVKYWWNTDHWPKKVEKLSNTDQILIKYWPNTDQILIKYWSNTTSSVKRIWQKRNPVFDHKKCQKWQF